MKILCVIPSRIRSTRLARKPLELIEAKGIPISKPLVQWTYESAIRCNMLTKVIVATDSEEIANVITALGGHVEMTDPALPTGTDRVAAVAKKFPEMQVVINLQGDQPFIYPYMLEQLIAPYLAGESPEMTTLASPLDMKKHNDPGIVKVIVNARGNAIYFSRTPIPYFRTQEKAPVYHHMGLYAFRRDFLLHYTNLPQTPLEKTESLEQLRALEHGYTIRVCLTEKTTLEINTQEDLEASSVAAAKFIETLNITKYRVD